MNMFQITPIGKVKSPLKNLDDCPLQESEGAPPASIEVVPMFRDGIKNIQVGAKLIVLTWLHKSDRTVLATYPRNNTKAALVGVFSTRSPDRPNPIGIHHVEITAIVGPGEFQVSNLEVLDQTPVVDIKPDL